MEDLLAYLNQLTSLHNSGVNVIDEINATKEAINKILGLQVKKDRA